jgi:hypothetical protein
MNRALHTILVLLGVFLAVTAVVLLLPTEGDLGKIDFVQYWTAARLVLGGQKPYDPLLVDQVQQTLAVKEHPILMWNPPFILPLFLWTQLLPFRVAANVWLVMSLGLFAASLGLLCSLHRIASPLRNRYLLAYCLTLYPLALQCQYGQISSLLLVSLCGFLFFLNKNKLFLAGLALSISFVKPHLLYLVYVLLFIEAIYTKNWRVWAGIGCGIAVLTSITVVLQPSIIISYLKAWQQSPVYWQTPTVGSWLQYFTQTHTLFIRQLPTAIVGSVSLYFFIAKRPFFTSVTNSIALLLPWSLVTAPYGWVYDQMLLLPSVAYVLSIDKRTNAQRWRGAMLLGGNLLMALLSDGIGQQWMIWYPVLVGAITLSIVPKVSDSSCCN